MVVLGVVGSPRKDGRTSALIDAALQGAESAGGSTEKAYLVDYDVRPFTGSGGSREAFGYCPRELSELCGKAEAIVIGAPVYWGDINGLTKDFMDTVRIRNANGKPALGIAIAGGSGKGLFSGVQTIYHFFYHRQMRGIDPTPVTRFNFQEALEQLKASGARLADLAKEPAPFPGARNDDRWEDVVAYYSSLPYFKCDPVDEFVALAGQLIRISEGELVEQAKTELEQALALIEAGERGEAGRHAVKSYRLLYFSA